MFKHFTRITHNTYFLGVISWLLILPLFYSCTSTKAITYFQSNSATEMKRYAALATIEQIPERIQPDDILTVIVNSLSEETNALFNSLNTNHIQLTSFPGAVAGGTAQPLGHSVNQNGEVNLPLVGKIKLGGMTLTEAGVTIEGYLSQYVKDPSVKVRLLNHKFTVIGEVNRPGIYNLLANSNTLPEVIGIAGDLTLFGRRDNVMLIRTINNKREMVKLDLTSRQVLNSPYYFIENNDVIYVASRSARITGSDRTLQLIPIILSITTTSLLLYNTFLR